MNYKSLQFENLLMSFEVKGRTGNINVKKKITLAGIIISVLIPVLPKLENALRTAVETVHMFAHIFLHNLHLMPVRKPKHLSNLSISHPDTID